MEPPVRHIIVLRQTTGTHRKGSHGCGGPVIRKSLYDGETGTAVCAVDKRIIDTPGIGMKISKALVTYSDVRTDLRNALFIINAGGDCKFTVTPCLCFSYL
jgi:hypothetical protein